MLKSLLSFGKPPKTDTDTKQQNGSSNGSNNYIFPKVDPAVDGPDCDKDCADCTIKYPSRFKVNTIKEMYGGVKPFAKHVLVATGKSDWAEKVHREEGSLMEAFKQGPFEAKDGHMTVLASNMSVEPHVDDDQERTTSVLVLPSFVFVDSMTPTRIPEFMDRFVDSTEQAQQLPTTTAHVNGDEKTQSIPTQLTSRPCLRDCVVLLCSHKRRDARCGISAPLIKRELERQLRPLGLYRDEDDQRPGGVGIFFVSHVGGHKFAANVLIYRKAEEQMIWLARVRPQDCEGIVKHTVLNGKVVHPEYQLRGGFDMKKGLTSW
ncbi:hypothetical protein FQN53_003351 [Emmonsiellopsis sp. PD_33]|nr:hypothetical protein FQN53_003351 [Emmonsiellopsis sp. PD_33]KAK2794214.1 hypothetical protein FQN51_000915 [Onygenales sp. PD_10]